MRKRFFIVSLIAITATSWGQRSNAPEYHKKDDNYLFRFGYYLGINQVNFKAEYSRYTLDQMEIQPQLGFNVGLFADFANSGQHQLASRTRNVYKSTKPYISRKLARGSQSRQSPTRGQIDLYTRTLGLKIFYQSNPQCETLCCWWSFDLLQPVEQ